MKHRIYKILSVILCLFFIITPVIQPKKVEAFLPLVVPACEVGIPFLLATLAMLGGNAYNSGSLTANTTISSEKFNQIRSDYQATIDADSNKRAAFIEMQDQYNANCVSYVAGGAVGAFNGVMDQAKLATMGIGDIFNGLNNTFTTYQANAQSGVPLAAALQLTTLGMTYRFSLNGIPYYMKDYVSTYTIAHTGYTSIDVKKFSSGDINLVRLRGMQNWYCYDPVTQTANQVAILSVYTQIAPVPAGTRCEIQYFDYVSALATNTFLSTFGIGAIDGTTLPVNGTMTGTAVLPAVDGAITATPVLPYVPENPTVYNISNPSYVTNTYNTTAGAVPWVDIPAVPISLDPPAVEPVPIDEPMPWAATALAAVLSGEFFISLGDALSKFGTDVLNPGFDAVISSITSTLTGINTAIGTATGAITGAITGALTGIDTAIGTATGAITGTITGAITGITDTITGIQTAVTDFTAPATETINWDKLKTVSLLIFNKFPFSLPFDYFRLLGFFNGNPVAPNFSYSVDLTSFNAGVIPINIDLGLYDEYSGTIRSFNIIAFIVFMIFATKSLIWK